MVSTMTQFGVGEALIKTQASLSGCPTVITPPPRSIAYLRNASGSWIEQWSLYPGCPPGARLAGEDRAAGYRCGKGPPSELPVIRAAITGVLTPGSAAPRRSPGSGFPGSRRTRKEVEANLKQEGAGVGRIRGLSAEQRLPEAPRRDDEEGVTVAGGASARDTDVPWKVIEPPVNQDGGSCG